VHVSYDTHSSIRIFRAKGRQRVVVNNKEKETGRKSNVTASDHAKQRLCWVGRIGTTSRSSFERRDWRTLLRWQRDPQDEVSRKRTPRPSEFCNDEGPTYRSRASRYISSYPSTTCPSSTATSSSCFNDQRQSIHPDIQDISSK
jgi:hypothetical protein